MKWIGPIYWFALSHLVDASRDFWTMYKLPYLCVWILSYFKINLPSDLRVLLVLVLKLSATKEERCTNFRRWHFLTSALYYSLSLSSLERGCTLCEARSARHCLRSWNVPWKPNLVLMYPAPEIPMLLDTEASSVGQGEVLSQLDAAGGKRVFGYASIWISLTKPGRNYCITWQELPAIVFGVRKFQAYLVRPQF